MAALGGAAAAIGSISPIISTLGTVVGIVGRIAAGRAEQQRANYIADQQEASGKVALANASRKAQEARHLKDLHVSRIIAQAGADGFSTDDASTIKAIAEAEEYGGYQAGGLLWQGKTDKEALDRAAESSRKTGKAVFASSIIGGIGAGLSAAGTFFGQYAGGGYKAPASSGFAPYDYRGQAPVSRAAVPYGGSSGRGRGSDEYR